MIRMYPTNASTGRRLSSPFPACPGIDFLFPPFYFPLETQPAQQLLRRLCFWLSARLI